MSGQKHDKTIMTIRYYDDIDFINNLALDKQTYDGVDKRLFRLQKPKIKKQIAKQRGQIYYGEQPQLV